MTAPPVAELALAVPSTDLDGKVAVVTGAARGLGAGVARHLAAAGARVIVTDVSAAAETASALPGGRGRAARLDVTDAGQVQQLVSDVVTEHGRLDVWVNNAGVVHAPAPVLDTEPETLRRTMAVNAEGMLICSRAAGRVMADAGSGRIVNIASARAKVAWPGLGAYSASKAAVVALTQALALELGPSGVTVNAICPGTMWTEMARDAFALMAAEVGRPLEELMAEHVKGIPVGRLGTPDDVGALAAFLASDAAGFITAAALNLTGGEDPFF